MKPTDIERIKRVTEDRGIVDSLYLVKNGVPFDVAFSLDDHTRFAWCVIMGQHAGGKFNWSTMRWDDGA